MQRKIKKKCSNTILIVKLYKILKKTYAAWLEMLELAKLGYYNFCFIFFYRWFLYCQLLLLITDNEGEQ